LHDVLLPIKQHPLRLLHILESGGRIGRSRRTQHFQQPLTLLADTLLETIVSPTFREYVNNGIIP
jgi:hypothetical protein